MSDRGFTHIALPCTNLERTIRFYEDFGGFSVVHKRHDEMNVAWLSDCIRPFVIVLLETSKVDSPLGSVGHLGVAVDSREEVDRRAEQARAVGINVQGPADYGPPIGYAAIFPDPDGHFLELAFGQDVDSTVANHQKFDQGGT